MEQNTTTTSSYRALTAFQIIVRELFVVSLLTYLLFSLIDDISRGFISDFFNLHILLGIVVVSGIITMLFPSADAVETRITKGARRSIGSALMLLGLGVIAAVLVLLRTATQGKVSALYALLAGLATAGITYILSLSDGKKYGKKEDE